MTISSLIVNAELDFYAEDFKQEFLTYASADLWTVAVELKHEYLEELYEKRALISEVTCELMGSNEPIHEWTFNGKILTFKIPAHCVPKIAENNGVQCITVL